MFKLEFVDVLRRHHESLELFDMFYSATNVYAETEQAGMGPLWLYSINRKSL